MINATLPAGARSSIGVVLVACSLVFEDCSLAVNPVFCVVVPLVSDLDAVTDEAAESDVDADAVSVV